jgi:hypothetical protein
MRKGVVASTSEYQKRLPQVEPNRCRRGSSAIALSAKHGQSQRITILRWQCREEVFPCQMKVKLEDPRIKILVKGRKEYNWITWYGYMRAEWRVDYGFVVRLSGLLCYLPRLQGLGAMH